MANRKLASSMARTILASASSYACPTQLLGPAAKGSHDDLKDDFLVELVSFCSHLTIPYVVGGDFNILREAEDKNKK